MDLQTSSAKLIMTHVPYLHKELFFSMDILLYRLFVFFYSVSTITLYILLLHRPSDKNDYK